MFEILASWGAHPVSNLKGRGLGNPGKELMILYDETAGFEKISTVLIRRANHMKHFEEKDIPFVKLIKWFSSCRSA